MFYFLCGEDTYRSRQKLREIVEHYKEIHKSGLNLKYFNKDNFSLERLKDEIQTASMFEEKKLLVLEDVLAEGTDKEEFSDLIKKFKNSEDIIVFYLSGKPDSRLGLVKFLKEESISQEFRLLEGAKLESWVKKEFSGLGGKIDPQALEKLISFVGSDLWQMESEVKKLVNFKLGKKIEKADVELLVKPKVEADIFQTIEAIAQKDKKGAFFLVHKHLEKGDAPTYLLAMINFQFRNLLIIKDLIEKQQPYYTISKTTKLHPYVVKKTWQLASKFTLEELKKIYQKIFRVDLSIKSGRVSPRIALELFLAEL